MITLDEKSIREHLIMYNKVSGISCFSIDETGKTLHHEGITCQYCEKFRELSGDKCSCDAAHLYAAKQAEKLGEPYVYFCPAGLVHWTAPIVIKGMFRGALLAGPVQMNLPDDYMIDNIIEANQFNISNRGILLAYVRLVPIVEPERVRYLAEMLYVVAKDIMEDESRVLTERKKFYLEQAAINEGIQDAKARQEHISEYYPAEMETELVAKVKRGDKIGAKTILNELMGHVLFNNGNNLEVTKARVLELMIVLSRAAVEGGGNMEMIFGLKLKYLNEIYELGTVEGLCEWMIKILERFTDSVYTVENENNSYIVQKAISYINENYMNDISLESVSEFVYLSTSYFSRLFKKETGVNFTDYLNKVRVEESKKYLADLKIPLSEIANMVGFTDQSYFTKVFKKIEGVSPGQFRKMG
ncbi:HTH-type transcriptional regulator YesS [Oxobacter pfennigii]|uniref:HTH-type transcriptional regulator YesS n=1 Tax=Oxobacter pfennigii TaxID=36849 RepID=A0A0P8W9Y1_9CLOT|nr:PocR ligand-binding domain-containing protein [Oxobacter pfennigii]KPU44525.1 HTH-type transcriptional regulator YesS [Oxobacter pfennigii]